jgi:sugar/nucleoside kinase (ribokinase family)
MENKKINFLAIGDTVVDAFIRIKNAHVTCNLNNESCEICMAYGSKIPFESAQIIAGVGNSANAAVAAARLGLTSAIYTPIGNDDNGKLCLKALEENKVDTRFVDVQDGIPTNYHYVLWYKDERTILIKHEDYVYHLPDLGEPSWIYLSSLGENAKHLHGEIVDYLKKHPGSKLAFQPGTFQIKLGIEEMKEVYAHTEVFICNKEEAQIIVDDLTADVLSSAKKIMDLGPKIVLITDGPKGAYAYDGADLFFMPTYPDPFPPYERTGAGDAFASTFVSFLGLGFSVAESLKRAPINSMSVVQKVGAQEGLLSREELETFLTDKPENYEIKKIA